MSRVSALPNTNRTRLLSVRTPERSHRGPSLLPMLDTSRLRDLAVSDAGFVFDPTTGHTYNINPTALFVLNALKAGDAPEAIVTNLQASFEV